MTDLATEPNGQTRRGPKPSKPKATVTVYLADLTGGQFVALDGSGNTTIVHIDDPAEVTQISRWINQGGAGFRPARVTYPD